MDYTNEKNQERWSLQCKWTFGIFKSQPTLLEWLIDTYARKIVNSKRISGFYFGTSLDNTETYKRN